MDLMPGYVLRFPLCGVPGDTIVPGNHTETIEQQAGCNLKRCLDKCSHSNSACYSVAFNALYAQCLFFSRVVEETQLTEDTASNFVHYDLNCTVT